MWNVSPIRILGMLLLPVTQQLTKFQPTLAMPRNQCHCLLKKEILKYRYYSYEKKIWTEKKNSEIIVESSYYVKYRLPIIMSKVVSKILSNENVKTGVSKEKGFFWHMNSHFGLKTTETPVFMFSVMRIFEGTFDIIFDNPYLT